MYQAYIPVESATLTCTPIDEWGINISVTYLPKDADITDARWMYEDEYCNPTFPMSITEQTLTTCTVYKSVWYGGKGTITWYVPIVEVVGGGAIGYDLRVEKKLENNGISYSGTKAWIQY